MIIHFIWYFLYTSRLAEDGLPPKLMRQTYISPPFPILDLARQESHIALYNQQLHYDDVIMTMLASQITSLTVVYSIVYSDVNQRKHQSSASLAFVREIHRRPVNFPHKWPVTRKMFPFDDVIIAPQNVYFTQEKHVWLYKCIDDVSANNIIYCIFVISVQIWNRWIG